MVSRKRHIFPELLSRGVAKEEEGNPYKPKLTFGFAFDLGNFLFPNSLRPKFPKFTWGKGNLLSLMSVWP